jgi:hypothetical protein
MDSNIYRRGDIITHPIAGKAWLHIAEVQRDNNNKAYYYKCINQKTGKEVILLAGGNDSIRLISETSKR